MRVLIIGIDALEYDLVRKLDLKNLKQLEWGKLSLPLDPGDEALTPVIWGGFITGSDQSDLIKGFRHWKNPIVRFVSENVFQRFKLYKMGCKLGKLLRRFGAEQKPEVVSGNTIFDMGKSFAISIPAYNEDQINFLLREKVMEALEDKITHEEFDNMMDEAFIDRKNRFFEALDKDWNVLMVHFFLTDLLMHLHFDDDIYAENLYRTMDRLVVKIKKRLAKTKKPDDVLILIISDHGIKKGIHTDHAFYSSNKKLGLKDPSILDFYKIIEKALTNKTI